MRIRYSRDTLGAKSHERGPVRGSSSRGMFRVRMVYTTAAPRPSKGRPLGCHRGETMSINVAFKIHEALVFCTDGLATLSTVDAETGQEHIASSVPDVEK